MTNLTSDLAGKVPLSTVTAKGDRLVATGSGAVTRLGAGSNGQVLTADSTQTAGVKWGSGIAPSSFLGAVGFSYSASAASGFTDFTNNSVTVTVGSGGTAGVRINILDSNSILTFQVLRDSTVIKSSYSAAFTGGGGITDFKNQHVVLVDSPGAGTHTYKVQVSGAGAAASFSGSLVVF